MSSLSPLLRLSGLVAALLFVLAVLGFGAGLEGYAQARHPVALLGAQGVPHALAFNLLGFVLPGLLAVVVAECLRRGLSATAGWAPRVGSQMLLLAGLAFAAMGLLPLDVDDLHGPASQLHASAWMIWVLGFVAGTLLLGHVAVAPGAWPRAGRSGARLWRTGRAGGVCPAGRVGGAAGTTACVRLLDGLAGPGPAVVAAALRPASGARGAGLQRAGLETFAALRYAVPLCRRIRVFHDQR